MKTASMKDFEKITTFYKDVCLRTPKMAQYCRWIYGQHPHDKMIENFIRENVLHVIEENGTIKGCVALTPYQKDDYHEIPWSLDLKNDEVCVMHLLAVNPDFAGQGFAGKMLYACEQTARMLNKKSLRLDALESNTPAQKMYEHKGFALKGKHIFYAENTGWTDFLFYEKNL